MSTAKQKNCYASLHLQQMNPAISAELFDKLARLTSRPVQIMVNSENTEMVNFLIAGGCACKRKCYETEASRDDYIGSIDPSEQSHLFQSLL